MDQLQDQNLLNLEVTEETKSNLTALSLWMTITAITGLSSAALTIINTIRVLMRFGRFGFYNSLSMVSLLVPLITVAISLALNFVLLNAANGLKKGLLSADQYSLNSGMSKLANYFRITGIVIICVLALAILFFLFGIVMAISRGFGR